ncbi:unnamed protein product [Caenorhabditis brenneri]
MSEPVDENMKGFVQKEIERIKAEHEKVVSGWQNIELTDENIRHLHNLFKQCEKQEIQLFEEINFLRDKDKEIKLELATKKLKRIVETNSEPVKSGEHVLSGKSAKKNYKKKNKNKKKLAESNSKETKSDVDCSVQKDSTTVLENIEEMSELESPDVTNEPDSEDIEARPTSKPELIIPLVKIEHVEDDLTSRDEEESPSLPESAPVVKSEECKNNKQTNPEVKPKKRENPFDNEHLLIEPLLSSTPNIKEEESRDEVPDVLGSQYMSQESNDLKASLQKLATDITNEENNIRERIASGGSDTVDNGTLDDFISRANVVLKETEAVTVRKIAEAETKKFLTSMKLPTENALESISNSLMQDIWPKSNKWRSLARVTYDDTPLDEIDLKAKRKQDDQVEREVRAAIKSAGEPLSKKQIGQIRKASIVYRDFDREEQKETEFRDDQILKLVELVSAYEALNKMDELMCLRLAIAFCTKRRDYFLKMRPQNFMQFSYMYIYFLEKINSTTAAICACLNFQSTLNRDFDELEELMLNLFHEDYFLDEN